MEGLLAWETRVCGGREGIICGGMDLQNVVQLRVGITCRQAFKLPGV